MKEPLDTRIKSNLGLPNEAQHDLCKEPLPAIPEAILRSGRWGVYGTGLADTSRLMFLHLEGVITFCRPGSDITLFDWGCGDGTLIKDIQTACPGTKVSGCSFERPEPERPEVYVGDITRETHRIHEGTNIILSHMGLLHLLGRPQKEDFISHVRCLRGKLDYDCGFLICSFPGLAKYATLRNFDNEKDYIAVVREAFLEGTGETKGAPLFALIPNNPACYTGFCTFIYATNPEKIKCSIFPFVTHPDTRVKRMRLGSRDQDEWFVHAIKELDWNRPGPS